LTNGKKKQVGSKIEKEENGLAVATDTLLKSLGKRWKTEETTDEMPLRSPIFGPDEFGVVDRSRRRRPEFGIWGLPLGSASPVQIPAK
jgi:hypothetical protein